MRKAVRPILLFVVFFAALAGVANMLNRIEPFIEVPILRDKWTYWQKNKDNFDTVFIGTSRVFRGVMPSIFDQMSAAAGVPTKSYNFGIDGMFPPEDAYVAEHILRDPPKNLRYVVIEMGVFLGDFEGRPAKSIRSIYWHDWKRTWLCFREKLWPKKKSVKWKKWFEPDDEDPSPASIAMTHLDVFLVQALNIGRGASWWERIAFNRPIKPQNFGQLEDGFLPIPGDTTMKGEILKRFDEEMAERRKNPARVVPLRPYSQESFEDIHEWVKRAGAKTIFLIAPTTGELSGYPDPSTGVPTFNYRNIEKYPELFEKDARSDTAHMSAKGAELFTRRLAESFIEYARNQK